MIATGEPQLSVIDKGSSYREFLQDFRGHRAAEYMILFTSLCAFIACGKLRSRLYRWMSVALQSPLAALLRQSQLACWGASTAGFAAPAHSPRRMIEGTVLRQW
jgi:hypothetical protein